MAIGATQRRVALTARSCYVVLIFLATLTDLHPHFVASEVPPRLLRAVTSLMDMSARDAVDGVRNIALFAGFGAVWVVTSLSGRIWRSAWHAALVGSAISLIVEACQLVSPVRVASLVDVTTNTAGTLVGAWMICLLIVWVYGARRRKSFVGIPAFLFAGSYAVSTAMEAFTPLFGDTLLSRMSGGVVDRIEQAWREMQASSVFDLRWLDLPIFVPAGFFLVAATAELGMPYRSSWLIVAGAGAVASVVIEVVHGVAGQPIIWGAALVHALSVAAGAWCGTWILPRGSRRIRGRERPMVLLCAYLALVVYWSWRPFYPDLSITSLREQFSAVHWIPLQALSVRVDLFSVTDIVSQFLLYLPVGALLAVWPVRLRGPWRSLLPAVYFAIVLEAGKIVIAERFFDITHILIQVAGAVIGWIVVRRSGFTVYGEMWPPAQTTSSGWRPRESERGKRRRPVRPS